ncbi:MAG: SIR2 family protein [Gammaproteobacteria bacterium]|nr:SIR2 family protein [Gammaproteobacteria bacterium]
MEKPRRVFVTGAGFTRALVPDAPLLVDDFGNDALVETVRSLPKASQLLEAERRRHPKGFINLERLMTRLDTLMPYDYDHKAVDEIDFLYSALKDSFLRRISGVRSGKFASDDLDAFVAHCTANGAACITFNYDDFLDEALASSGIWNADWGYGFYCRSSSTAVSAIGGDRLIARFLLLKLHGSVNWRALLGHESPYALAAIVHHHAWGNGDVPGHLRPQVERHLEPDPVIVPPVLTKSGLVAQSVLRFVWTRAFAELAAADGVTFIGYSFPETDSAARVLFSEALRDLPGDRVEVVGREHTDAGKIALKSRYRRLLGDIPDERFFFDGAVEWIRSLDAVRRS